MRELRKERVGAASMYLDNFVTSSTSMAVEGREDQNSRAESESCNRYFQCFQMLVFLHNNYEEEFKRLYRS